MAENFNTTVNSLFKGMDNFITTKTVVGEAINIDGTIILPLVDVSFGVGAGSTVADKKSSAGGAMGGKMSPSAVLIIHDGVSKIINVKDQDATSKILDMVPDLITKFTSMIDSHKKINSDEVTEAAAKAAEDSAKTI